MVKIPEDAQKVYDEYEGTNPNNLDKKIELLTKYLKMIQDIKGTERVQAINLNKLNALKKKKDEIERIQKKKKGKSKSDPFSIKKSEEIQIALISRFFEIGVGKTTLLRNLTRAGDRLVGIPTNEPLIGVYQWQNIPFRLIELPALKEGYSAGVGNGPKIFSILRNCDLIALCIDLSIEPISQVNFILKQFEDVNIRINQKVPPIEIEKTGAHGIQVFFQSDSAKESIDLKDDIVELVNSSGLKNARIKIMGQISLQDVIDALNPSVAYKKAIIIATKGDSENSKLNYNKLMETFGAPLDKDVVPADSKSPPKFHIFPVSIVYENGWERRKEIMPLGELVQKELKFIRIFTKARNGEVAPRPIIFLKNKVSVEDVALKIHKQMLKHFRYANVYREGSKVNKIRAGLNYLLNDSDIVEIVFSQ